jgi:hypothetical protein
MSVCLSVVFFLGSRQLARPGVTVTQQWETRSYCWSIWNILLSNNNLESHQCKNDLRRNSELGTYSAAMTYVMWREERLWNVSVGCSTEYIFPILLILSSCLRLNHPRGSSHEAYQRSSQATNYEAPRHVKSPSISALLHHFWIQEFSSEQYSPAFNLRQTNSVEPSPSWEVTVSQLLKEFPIFYGVRKFITVFTGPYAELDECSLHPLTIFLWV